MLPQLEQLGFAFAVEDKSTGPLGKIEKAYHSLMGSFDKVAGKLSKAMKSYSESFKQLELPLDKHAKAMNNLKTLKEKLIKQIGKMTPDFAKLGKHVKEGAKEFKELGTEVKDAVGDMFDLNGTFATMGKLLGAAGIVGVIGGVVAVFVDAVKTTIEWTRTIAKLNEVYTATGKEAAEVSKAVGGVTYQFGRSREEAAALVRSMEDLGLTPKYAAAAGTSLVKLAKEANIFSAATGASVDQAARFEQQLLMVNKVSPANIRAIGFSIKNIADNTKMTTDELLAMNEALEPLMTKFADSSADARAAYTKNMLGIGGALSQANIDAKRAFSQFDVMLEEGNIEGIEALDKLSMATGESSEKLKELIRNDPAAIFDKLAKRSEFLRTTDPLGFSVLANNIKPLGMGMHDLTNLATSFGKEGQKSVHDTAIELAALSAKESAALDAAKRRQIHLDAVMDKFKHKWEELMLRIGGPLIEKVISPILDQLLPATEQWINTLEAVDWNAIFSGINTAIQIAYRAIKLLFEGVKAGFEFVGTILAGVASMIVAAFDTGWDGVFESGKGLFIRLSELSETWLDNIYGAFDKLIVKLGPVIGMDTKDAEARIAKREATEKAEKTKSHAATPTLTPSPVKTEIAKASATRTTTSPMKAEAEFPRQMTTSSPAMESLQRENNETLKKIHEALRTRGGASSASDAKIRTTLSFAGAGG